MINEAKSGRKFHVIRIFVKFIKHNLGFLLSSGLAILFLLLAIHGISWNEVAQTIRQIGWVYLALCFFITSIAMLLRSLRWRNLLSAQKSIPAMTMFWTTAVGYLGNSFLPGRAGEVIRSVALGNEAGVSKSFVFATTLAERVIDAVVLITTGLFLLPTLSYLPENLLPFLWLIGAFCGLILACFAFAPSLLGLFTGLLRRSRLPDLWQIKISEFVEHFAQGSSTFVHPSRAVVFLLFTAAIWLTDALGAVILSNSIGLSIQLSQAILFLVALALSSALPSTPGYIGLYQIVAVTVLPSFGFTRSQALTFILVLQFINILTILFWGMIGLAQLGIKLLPGEKAPNHPV